MYRHWRAARRVHHDTNPSRGDGDVYLGRQSQIDTTERLSVLLLWVLAVWISRFAGKAERAEGGVVDRVLGPLIHVQGVKRE